MACGLVDHSGNQREYSRNSENSRPSMRNSYGPTQASYSVSQRDSYSNNQSYN